MHMVNIDFYYNINFYYLYSNVGLYRYITATPLLNSLHTPTPITAACTQSATDLHWHLGRSNRKYSPAAEKSPVISCTTQDH